MSDDIVAIQRRFVEEYQTHKQRGGGPGAHGRGLRRPQRSPGFAPNREGVLQLIETFRAEIHDMFAEGDKVVTRKTFYGTHEGRAVRHPPTNKQISVQVIDIVRIEGGRMREHWNAVDQMGLMQQLGVVPS